MSADNNWWKVLNQQRDEERRPEQWSKLMLAVERLSSPSLRQSYGGKHWWGNQTKTLGYGGEMGSFPALHFTKWHFLPSSLFESQRLFSLHGHTGAPIPKRRLQLRRFKKFSLQNWNRRCQQHHPCKCVRKSVCRLFRPPLNFPLYLQSNTHSYSQSVCGLTKYLGYWFLLLILFLSHICYCCNNKKVHLCSCRVSLHCSSTVIMCSTQQVQGTHLRRFLIWTLLWAL